MIMDRSHIFTSQEIVEKLNTDKHVRIFVFSFRKNEGMYNDRLKGLACSNRGYYSKILYFGQIEAALQRLVQVRIVFFLSHFNRSLKKLLSGSESLHNLNISNSSN